METCYKAQEAQLRALWWPREGGMGSVGGKFKREGSTYCDFQGNRENSDWYWLHPYIGKWKGQLKHICPAIQHIFSVCSLTEKSSSAYAGLMAAKAV